MSLGSRTTGTVASFCRRGSPGKRGFSLIELMFSALIAGVLMTAMLMTMTVGDHSMAVNSDKIDLQSGARTVADWITRDLREAISWELNANNPTTNHMKCNLWSWDAVNNTWTLGSEFVEYEYDASSQTLYRRLLDSSGSVLEETPFTGVSMSPFYTAYISEFNNQFDTNALLQNRKLIVVIKMTKVSRSRTLTYTVVEEVKIRNG